jgi:hypothetical protein
MLSTLSRRVLREELFRSVVWAFLALVVWVQFVTSTDHLDATAPTLVGPPVLAWAAVTGSLVAVRLTKGGEPVAAVERLGTTGWLVVAGLLFLTLLGFSAL